MHILLYIFIVYIGITVIVALTCSPCFFFFFHILNYIIDVVSTQKIHSVFVGTHMALKFHWPNEYGNLRFIFFCVKRSNIACRFNVVSCVSVVDGEYNSFYAYVDSWWQLNDWFWDNFFLSIKYRCDCRHLHQFISASIIIISYLTYDEWFVFIWLQLFYNIRMTLLFFALTSFLAVLFVLPWSPVHFHTTASPHRICTGSEAIKNRWAEHWENFPIH